MKNKKIPKDEKSRRVIDLYEELFEAGIVKSNAEFSHSIGYEPSSWTNVKAGQRSFPDDKVPDLEKIYGINKNFILFGKQEKYLPKQILQSINPKVANFVYSDKQKIHSTNAKIINEIPGESFIDLPFISTKARASFSYEYYTDTQYDIETFKVYEPEPDVRYAKRKHVIIEIDGDSMGDRLPSGTKVRAYELDKSEWPYITGVIAVNYLTYFEVKRVKENSILKSGILTLHSDNASGGSKDIRHSDIVAMWKIYKIIDGPSLTID